ncbi:MAG: phage tail protein [Acidimicrobiia bacterium]
MPDEYSVIGARKGIFIFEVDGLTIGEFLEVSGLKLEIDVMTLEEGGENGFVHKLPGRMKWPNLTFKRGVTNDDTLLNWIQKCSGDGFGGQGNKLVRSSAAVTLVSADGERLRSWELDGAFPVRWSGPDFAAGDDGIATEELEIAHHGFVARTP